MPLRFPEAYDISKVFECAIEDVFLFDVSLRKSRADSSRQEVKSGNKSGWRFETVGCH